MHTLIYLLKYLAFLLFLTAISLAASCKGDDDMDNPFGLPNASENGENTFGCLINEEPWVAEIGSGVFDPTIHKITANFDEIGVGVIDNNNFSLIANYIYLPDSIYDIFTFNLKPISSEGIINLNELVKKDIKLTRSQPGIAINTKIYYLDTLYNNNLVVTKIDTLINVIAGIHVSPKSTCEKII